MAASRQHQRHRGRDQIVVLKRSLIIRRIGQLRRGLDIGDQGRAALNQRDLGAARMQILRDVVAAVAGADHDRRLAAPFFTVAVLAGMQHRAGEILQGRDVRHIRDAADAGRHHDVARMHRALAAIGAAQHHRPASFRLIVGATLELGAGPEVQLHGVDIGLEPVGELVLGDIDRPVRRERHIGQVIDLHLIVQRQRVIAFAPIVADPRLAIDDQRIDLQLLAAARRSKARPARRRPPARRDRGRHRRSRPCADRASWARENRANRIARAAALMPCCSSNPFSSSSAVNSVQAFSLLPSSASGISRRIPLPRPCSGLELEDRLDRVGAGAHHAARRGAIGIDREITGARAAGVGLSTPSGSRRRR